MALEGSAKLGNMVFPIQCFRLCDGNRFRVDFRHELQPTQTSKSDERGLHCKEVHCSSYSGITWLRPWAYLRGFRVQASPNESVVVIEA